jgi:hypothetical protein
MKERTKIHKATIASAYCLCFIAERSVDFAAVNPSIWPEFLAFFSPERRRSFDNVRNQIPNAHDSKSKPNLSNPNTFLVMMLRIWATLRSCPSFFSLDEAESQFIRSSLEEFQELLRLDSPDTVRLSTVRRNLGNCQWIIEKKWLKRDAWEVLRKVDHFCRNPLVGETFDFDFAVKTFLKM